MNNVRKRCFTTGIIFNLMGGYKSKTQSITANSSTEANSIAAYSAAKVAHYLCMLLKEVAYQQNKPTPIC